MIQGSWSLNLNSFSGRHCSPGQTDCCCHWILFNQPDFVGQKSKLKELVKLCGYQMIFYLKFHYKVSFIEQCWGFAKRVYCEFPTSSAEADLERNDILALNAVPLDSMRRYAYLLWYHHIFMLFIHSLALVSLRFSTQSLWFMDAYQKGLTGGQAAWASQKYWGHLASYYSSWVGQH